MGRPSEYTPAVADRICVEIAEGRSLRSILREADDLPAMSTVFKWLRMYPEFAEQYARAREIQADALADELLDIADDGKNDWMERKGEDGQSLGWRENGEAIQRSKLRVDTRKWIASKLKPKKYGERLELAGELTHRTADELTDEQLAHIATASGAGATQAQAGEADHSSVH